MFDLNKKEKPFTSFSGFGGGGLGLAGGAISAKTYVDDVFSAYVYEGNGNTQSINNGIDLAGEGGLVWVKCRSASENNILVDTERGVNGYGLISNSNSTPYASINIVTAFNSNGFTVGANGTTGQNGKDYTSWTFRKCPGFFDVVTYTGNGSHRDISHSLGSEPGSIWIKRTDGVESWICYHRSLDQGGGGSAATAHMAGLELESTGGQYGGTLRWSSSGGGEDHTATTFHVSGHNAINGVGMNYVAYIFAHDDQSFGTDSNESIIKCDTYTGDGTTNDSKKITLGFEPQFVLIKRINTSGGWYMHDNMRGIASGGYDPFVYANSANAETVDKNVINLHPDGFSVIAGEGHNGNGSTYVYIAIRRPNKPPEAAINVFTIDTSEGTSPTPPQFTSGFVSDFIIRKTFNAANNQFGSRLTGTNYMSSYSVSPESGASLLTWDFMDGWSNSVSDPPNTNLGCYMFKRAPGFMDVVTWTGDGAAVKNVAHNLEKVPEMVITKMRTYSGGGSYGGDRWYVYHKDVAGSLGLNQDSAIISSDTIFNSTPTATNLPFDNPSFDSLAVNGNNDTYVGYLFSTLAGISKVGSYSGTGNNVNVDCGFTSGARFLMIKRINGTGGWYVWDTLRGIGSGNDPYWLTNTTDNPVTNTDYVDPLSSGFTVTSSAPAALNASGGTYLFLAIA